MPTLLPSVLNICFPTNVQSSNGLEAAPDGADTVTVPDVQLPKLLPAPRTPPTKLSPPEAVALTEAEATPSTITFLSVPPSFIPTAPPAAANDEAFADRFCHTIVCSVSIVPALTPTARPTAPKEEFVQIFVGEPSPTVAPLLTLTFCSVPKFTPATLPYANEFGEVTVPSAVLDDVP